MEGRVEETQTTETKEKADKDGARGQGSGVGGGGAVFRKAGFCILERSSKAKSPLELQLHRSPLLPPCPYSVGASESKTDREIWLKHSETIKYKQAGRERGRVHTLTFPTQLTFIL